MMTQKVDSLQQEVSMISGTNYSLSLATIDQQQIIYNGKFSYLRSYANPHSGKWCHLLLLRSKNRYSKQMLAIITQTPDCHMSIVNTIENIATFIVNFFSWFYPPFPFQDEDDPLVMTPDNTIFIEYLPAGCFGPKSIREPETLAVMHFSWEEVQVDHLHSYYKATSLDGSSMWRYTDQSTINDLIARL